jgi:hypothetical protein
VSDVVDWYKYDKNKSSYVFNHRDEDGSMVLAAPLPRSELQRKAWAGARWYKELVE